jgi:L-ornithine Nalpha-acyltransferase
MAEVTEVQLERGRYRVRFAQGEADVARAQAFRARCFGLSTEFDIDRTDSQCTHVLVENRASGELHCCFRVMELRGAEVTSSYSARFYDLQALSGFDGPMLELGRFCTAADRIDPDILRLAWAALTRHVDRRQVRLLFGCSSFRGVDPEAYCDGLALLRARHLAPSIWAPGKKAKEVYRFALELSQYRNGGGALRQIPPLLRSYLRMGAWVSDHAVIDRELNTLHVFTGLELDAIPSVRKRLLRQL